MVGCGKTKWTAICPECKNPIGGKRGKPMQGNIRIDAAPLSKIAKAVDLGLKQEQIEANIKHSVRYYTHLESVNNVIIIFHYGDIEIWTPCTTACCTSSFICHYS